MTETTFTSPRLERPRDTPLAGVATALARTTGTEPVLWRVLFVVLTVFGGLGVALYLACYVTIPAEGEQHSLVSRLMHGDRRMTTRQVLLLAVVLVVSALALHDNGGAVVVLGLAALGYVWWHRRHPSPAPAPPPSATGVGLPPAESSADGWKPDSRPGETVEAVAPAWVPPAPRARSLITRLTLSAAALVVGVLLLVAASGAASVPTEVVLAVALAVVGVGLVASALLGRARGLVPVAFLLALALGGTFAARPAIDHGIGERSWSATTTGSYRLGIGHGTLTLPAQASDGGHITARLSVGQLTVLVPEGVHVIVRAEVRNGDIQGFDVDEDGHRVSHTFERGPLTSPALVVDAHVGIGMVEVRGA
jgi:phage shock protein PspC (stress-responsive transcriptional regulator)